MTSKRRLADDLCGLVRECGPLAALLETAGSMLTKHPPPLRSPPVKFDLIDAVLEQDEDRIVVLKQVSAAEEYLQDHFPGFPILPGVMMIETMIQAARRLLQARTAARLVLCEARAVKFGSMVRPGEALRMEVTLREEEADRYVCRAIGTVQRLSADENSQNGETAVSGRFTMRPVTTPRHPPARSGRV